MDESNQEQSNPLVIYSDPIIGVQDILSKESDVNVLIESLFRTDEGKRYARQVEEQKKFTTVGIVFQLVQQFMIRFLPRIPGIIADEELKNWTSKKIDEAKDVDEATKDQLRVLPVLMESLLQSNSQIEANDADIDVWGTRANERFLGGMVFALHSYLQAYVDSIIDRLLREDSAREDFLQGLDRRRFNPRIGLTELGQLEGDRNTMLGELIKRSLPFNLLSRMGAICEALGCHNDLKEILKKFDIAQAKGELMFLCDMRNQIAHGNPAPDLQDYGIQFEPYNWKEAKEKISDDVASQWSDAPAAVFTLIELGCDAAEKASPMKYISLLNRLPIMAILYTAIFDFVISQRIKTAKLESNRQIDDFGS